MGPRGTALFEKALSLAESLLETIKAGRDIAAEGGEEELGAYLDRRQELLDGLGELEAWIYSEAPSSEEAVGLKTALRRALDEAARLDSEGLKLLAARTEEQKAAALRAGQERKRALAYLESTLPPEGGYEA